ncbi:MAG: anti-CBASS protein Acb1 family protein, partial [Shewanella sp.]
MAKKRQYQRRTAQNSSSSRARTPYQYAGFYDNANTRLDVYSVGGYPNEVAFSDLWSAYRRKGLAKVVIDLPVRTCWHTPPHIECTDAAWMKSLERLVEHHDMWERLRALDIRQRIGQYGGLWLIAKERAGAEAKGPIQATGPEGLLNMRPLFESQLDVTQWIDDIQSADYGNPKYYNYRSQVPGTKSQGDSQSFELHPSRLFIFAEGADDGSIYGI